MMYLLINRDDLDFKFSAEIFCDLCKLYIARWWLNDGTFSFVSRLNGALDGLARLI